MATVTTTTKAAAAMTSWTTWFSSRDSASTINKTRQEALLIQFDHSHTEDSTLAAVIKHDEIAFLHRIAIGSKKLAVFHHLIEIGGTLYDSGTKEYGFIQGLGEEIAQPLTPDISALMKSPSAPAVSVPTMNAVMGVKTKEDVDTLATSATVTYKPRNFVPIPPFLLEIVHDSITATGGDARDILVKSVEGIKKFDSTHSADATYQDKAQSKSKQFLHWVYLASQDDNAIEKVATTGCSNVKVMQQLQHIQNTELHTKPQNAGQVDIGKQVESSLKRPFEVLAASTITTSEFMNKLTQLQSQNSEKNSKTFKKIPAKFQQMILVAASVSEVTEVDYNAKASEFFKCSSTLHGQVMINSVLETENIECSVSAAMTTMLLMGSFLWRNAFSPSGLAASILTSEGIMKNDTLHEGMVLDYATKFEMSSASLSKLTKTQVLYPSDIDEMTHRLRGLHRLATFFFKRHGFLSQGLKKVVNFCLDNRMLLRTRIYLDGAFIAKFICAIDDRIYQWLKQCSIHQMVTDTDMTLVDFTSMLLDIQLNRFVYTLPPSIAKLATSTENADDRKRPESRGGRKCKR